MRLVRTLLLLGLAGTIACSTYPTFESVPLDCTADSQYELQSPIDISAGKWWVATDGTGHFDGGDTETASKMAVETMTDGARCGSTSATVFRASHNNDWGALAGYSGFGAPRSALGWEGLSFWARAPGATAKYFTILLDDSNTYVYGDPTTTSNPGVNCKIYEDTVNASGGTGTATGPDGQPIPGGGSSTVTRAKYPDECGNGYSVIVQVTADWRFYTIPFSRFQQGATPNRVPNAVLTKTGTVPGTGLITSELWNLLFRMPKEITSELWIDNLAFYSKKAPVDGGADAAQM